MSLTPGIVTPQAVRDRLAGQTIHDALIEPGVGLDLDGITIDDPMNSPAGRVRGDHDLNPDLASDARVRAAAVLVPLVMRPDGITVLLTRRTAHLSHHAGQISFPGGRVEREDDGPIATALRETFEEVAIPASMIEPIGWLDRYVIARTGFAVTPIVGLVSPEIRPVADPGEVAEVFEVPLAFFLDPANRKTGTAEYEGVARSFFTYHWQGRTIWGATAGMLVNLTDLLAAG